MLIKLYLMDIFIITRIASSVPYMMVDKTIINLIVYHMSVTTLLIEFTYHCHLYQR